MAAPNNNENQGLKIAVACFVMLSVILAVTTYFGFKNYAEADKKLEIANGEVSAAKKQEADIQRILNDVKDKAGFSKTEDAELVKAMTKEVEELTKRVTASVDAGRAAVRDYKGAGGAVAKVDEINQSLDNIIAGLNDPAKTLLSTMGRLQELLNNQALLAANLGLEYKDISGQFVAANQVNQSKLDVEVGASKASKTDLEGEHNKHETDRQALMAKVDVLQSDTNRQAQEINKLKGQIAQMEDDFRKQRDDLLVQVRQFRDVAEKKETVLDKKDGTITFVDYGRGEIRADIGRSVGAREQMVLTVFDRNAPGIPSDKPKGSIELIQVGPNSSIARIVQTKEMANPIRNGDQLYSPTWDPGRPQQFALIGKMDVNRDGRDDRADLKRMIQASGGIVSYDLPPPGVGAESGKLTPLISWYVVDERQAYHPSEERDAKYQGNDDQAFLTKRTEAIKTARLDGIRPLPIDRLLSQLGYVYGSAVTGRIENSNPRAIEQLINPKGRVGVLPTPGETTPPETEKADDKPAKDADKPSKDADKPN